MASSVALGAGPGSCWHQQQSCSRLRRRANVRGGRQVNLQLVAAAPGPPETNSPAAASPAVRLLHKQPGQHEQQPLPGPTPLSSSSSPSFAPSKDSSTLPQQYQQPPASQWYTVVALSALAAMICSIDRAAISVAILPMSEQYHWTDSTKGLINSAFYVGYTVTNLVGGYLATSISSKKVLGAGVAIWSLFTITTPAAAGAALPVLMANRCLMGAGEGVTFPCVQSLVKGWVPADARSRATTLVYSGGQLGTIIALLTAPLIINEWGWPAVFELFGLSGLLWMAAWTVLVADHPPRQPTSTLSSSSSASDSSSSNSSGSSAHTPSSTSSSSSALSNSQPVAVGSSVEASLRANNSSAAASSGEQAVPQLHLPQGLAASSNASSNGTSSSSSGAAAGNALSWEGVRQLPWRTFFTNKPYLAIVMAHSAFGVGHYVSLSWLPTYYNQEFGVDVQQSALLSVLPWLLTVVASSSSGWIADSLSNSGLLSMTNTRKALQLTGSIGPAACLLYLATTSDTPGALDMGKALLLLTATLSLGGFQSAGFASNHQDISSKYAAVLFGITNALSSLMGTLSVYGTGVILEKTGSWSLVFELVAAFYVVGACFYASWASAEPQFE